VEARNQPESSLRRALGAEYDDCYARGLALREAEMIALAFAQLATIISAAAED